MVVVRRLLNYESPYLAVKLSGQSASLVMRKRLLLLLQLAFRIIIADHLLWLFSYWDPAYDDELLKSMIGTKLVYNQFGDDLKRYWVQPTEQQVVILKRLMEQENQAEVRFLKRH